MSPEPKTVKDLPGKSSLEFLGDIISESYQGLMAFYDLINSEGNDDLCIVLRVLLDRMEADLDKVGQIIVENLGMVEIEVAEEFIRRDGQTYHKGDLMRVVIKPLDETAQPLYLKPQRRGGVRALPLPSEGRNN